jgi:hypothetical protein
VIAFVDRIAPACRRWPRVDLVVGPEASAMPKLDEIDGDEMEPPRFTAVLHQLAKRRWPRVTCWRFGAKSKIGSNVMNVKPQRSHGVGVRRALPDLSVPPPGNRIDLLVRRPADLSSHGEKLHALGDNSS